MKQVYFIETTTGSGLWRHIEVKVNKGLVLNHVLLFFQHSWAPRNLLELVDNEQEPYWSSTLYDIMQNAKWCKSRERCLLLAQLTPQKISRARLELMLRVELGTFDDKVVIRANGVTGEPAAFSNAPLRDITTLSQMFPNQRHSLDV